MKKREKLKPTRFYVDNEILRYAPIIGRAAFLIYCVLARYANAKTQLCYPSYPTILKGTGYKKKDVISQGIRILEACQMIHITSPEKQGRGYPNLYLLRDHTEWLSFKEACIKVALLKIKFKKKVTKKAKKRSPKVDGKSTKGNQLSNLPKGRNLKNQLRPKGLELCRKALIEKGAYKNRF